MLAQELEIYKAADQLLHLALQVQAQVPRAYRMAVGQRIANECADILVMVARANAAEGASRLDHIAKLLERLEAARDHLTTWLPQRLQCTVNPRKTILQPVDRGIDFVGHVIQPWHRTTRPRTVARALQRVQQMDRADVFTAGNSYLGLLRQASHSHHHQALLARALMKRGHAVAGDLSKIYRRSDQA